MAAKARVAVVEAPERANLPFWREALTGVDYLRLKASPVYYGFGVPKGQREPVVVVPGFLGADFYLLELHFWLRRMGYAPYLSRIGHNAKCPDILTHRLLATVNRAFNETGRPVHIIGHSFGGVLARGVAFRKPERVASVTMLGSPFNGTKVNPWILNLIRYVRKHTQGTHKRNRDCYTMDCACGFVCTMRNAFPKEILQTAIYSKTDGVVDWHSSVTGIADCDVEVSGTHVGLVWNPEVYRCIGARLQTASALLPERFRAGTVDIPAERRAARAIREDVEEVLRSTGTAVPSQGESTPRRGANARRAAAKKPSAAAERGRGSRRRGAPTEAA